LSIIGALWVTWPKFRPVGNTGLEAGALAGRLRGIVREHLAVRAAAHAQAAATQGPQVPRHARARAVHLAQVKPVRHLGVNEKKTPYNVHWASLLNEAKQLLNGQYQGRINIFFEGNKNQIFISALMVFTMFGSPFCWEN
jgi:hypothetical protein